MCRQDIFTSTDAYYFAPAADCPVILVASAGIPPVMWGNTMAIGNNAEPLSSPGSHRLSWAGGGDCRVERGGICATPSSAGSGCSGFIALAAGLVPPGCSEPDTKKPSVIETAGLK